MTLRARLTIFYTVLLGAGLLLFGLVVYFRVSSVLRDQIDVKLESAAQDILQVLRANEEGELGITALMSFDSTVYIQAWDSMGHFVGDTATFDYRLRGSPLDPVGLESEVTVFRDVIRAGGDLHLRVLSVPLATERGPVGALQVGTSLDDVVAVRRNLLQSLMLAGVATMAVAALVGWMITRQALSPLATVTRAASEITRADDLSRRIPELSNKEDEVGRLIQAFNQTLERLEDVFHTQRRFLADVGHELRTPLTVIKGNADLMRRVGKMDAESLEGMENEIDRLTRMVGDLLLLAQAESGKLPLDDQMVELDTIMLEVYQQAMVLAGDTKAVNIGEIDQVLVCGDQDRLKQVILNLVSNAVTYTQEGGEILVSLGKDEEWGWLSVMDNGYGIPEKDLAHIFERFFRAEKSRSRSKDGKGYGLGLSIAYWIVKNHGGRIDVESTEGQGTTFTIWLPLALL